MLTRSPFLPPIITEAVVSLLGLPHASASQLSLLKRTPGFIHWLTHGSPADVLSILMVLILDLKSDAIKNTSRQQKNESMSHQTTKVNSLIKRCGCADGVPIPAAGSDQLIRGNHPRSVNRRGEDEQSSCCLMTRVALEQEVVFNTSRHDVCARCGRSMAAEVNRAPLSTYSRKVNMHGAAAGGRKLHRWEKCRGCPGD